MSEPDPKGLVPTEMVNTGPNIKDPPPNPVSQEPLTPVHVLPEGQSPPGT